MPLRTDPDLADLLGSFAPPICDAFAATIRGMDAGAVAQSLSVMPRRPVHAAVPRVVLDGALRHDSVRDGGRTCADRELLQDSGSKRVF